MLLANIIWLGMLCKKLAGVNDGEIVKKVNILRATHARGAWENFVGCLRQTSTLAMLLANMNWLGVLYEQMAGIKV